MSSASATEDEKRRKAEHPQCSAAEAIDMAFDLFGLEADPDPEDERQEYGLRCSVLLQRC